VKRSHAIWSWFVGSYERANALVSLVSGALGGLLGEVAALSRLPWELEAADWVHGLLLGILVGYPIGRSTCLLVVPSTRKGWWLGLLASGLLALGAALVLDFAMTSVSMLS